MKQIIVDQVGGKDDAEDERNNIFVIDNRKIVQHDKHEELIGQ